jgi:hypothetical protein
MNKIVIVIIIFTIVALVILALYSFGPLANKRNSGAINPNSQKPQGQEQVPINNQPGQFNSFHNRDVRENYYSISLPQDWPVQSGQKAGSYSFAFPDGKGTAELLDVPDNTTLELYILSQQEPKLRKALPGYSRTNYKKLTVKNYEAYELSFSCLDKGQNISIIKTYIAGQDNAIVITLNINQDQSARLSPISISIVESFSWENK